MGEQDQPLCSFGDAGNCEVENLENLPQKINKIGTDQFSECNGFGWFSKLPESIIVEILSRMPITDAYRTTILSKRWNCMWTSVENVSFGHDRYWYGGLEFDGGFISFLDNVLGLLSCSMIKKFHLCCSLNAFKDYASKLDEWIGISVEKNVQDLQLKVVGNYDIYEVYYLPQVLCSSSSLKKLECRKCSISEDSVINWISLKSLTLEYLETTDEAIAEIISGCPQLESLKLGYFQGFKRLHMTSPRCKRLELSGHTEYHEDFLICPFGEDCSLDIVAPYIEHLKISEDLNCMMICLKDVSSLVHAELTFKYYEMTDPECYCEQLKDTVKQLFKSICCADTLTISSWFLQVVYMLEMEGFLFPQLECKQLTIESTITKHTILGIGVLLRSAPQLENLEIYISWDVLDSKYEEYWNKAVDSVGDNYLSLKENVFRGSMQNVKHVEIILMFCKRYYKGVEESEINELVEIVLKHAAVVEKLVIAPFHKGERTCSICSTGISKMVEQSLAFGGASHSGLVSFER